MKKITLILYYKILEALQELKKIQNVLMRPFVKHPTIMNTGDTIAYIVKNKCSVSRFGDGEFSLVQRKSIAFQNANRQLSAIFKEILKAEPNNHITCLPYALIDRTPYTKKAQTYWKTYLSYNRLSIYKHLNLKKKYFDTQFTRLYMDAQNKDQATRYFKQVKDIWNHQDVVIIEGEKSRLGVGNDLFDHAKSIKRIIGPPTDAFDVYNSLLNYIKQQGSKNNLYLLALGPTATALAFDLSKLGYWAIDIGHIDIEYEWMLMKATEKVPVKNKFVGDIFSFDEHEGSLIENYKNQIIIHIK